MSTTPNDPAEVAALLASLRDMADNATTEEEVKLVTARIAGITRAYRAKHGIGVPTTLAEQAVELDPGYRIRPHLQYLSDRIGAAVADVEAGKNRMLAVSMPPRAGKSTLLSLYMPVWMLRRHPDWKIGTVSYDGKLSSGWARQARRLIEQKPELGIELQPDGGAGGYWETMEGGGVTSASVRGPLTGLGFNCVSGDTHIECEYGTLTARQAYQRGITRILAYDHAAGRAVWGRVEATQRTASRRVLTIRTQGGRSITCTPDHLVYTGRGYLPAGSLRGGETLLGLVAGPPMHVREHVGRAEDGGAQSDTQRVEDALHVRVCSQGYGGGAANAVLPGMRHTSSPGADELFPGVLGGAKGPTEGAPRARVHAQQLPGVRRGVPEDVTQDYVLLEGLCEHSARRADDRQAEPALQDWDELREVVQPDAPIDTAKGSLALRGMRSVPGTHIAYAGGRGSDKVESGRPPHRREPSGQPSGESDHPVPDLPCDSPQVEGDSVASVVDLGEATVDVYDFQVEGAHNFFGDGLLVHNCLIIDDPTKDFVEAHSVAMRDALWNWWLSVALTRLENPYLVLTVATRWHENDLIGRIFDDEYEGDPSKWERIALPAIADSPDDVLGRTEGEPLYSPLVDETREQALDRWTDIKRSVGSYTFNAMFQQHPSSPKGVIFDTSWWRFWTMDERRATEDGRVVYLDPSSLTGGQWLDSWDCNFGDTEASAASAGSWVVGQRWVRAGPNRYLVAQLRDRWNFTQTLSAMRRWAGPSNWSSSPCGSLVHLRLIEKKANGAAIINVLREEISGLKPILPKESKEARARSVTPEIESGHVFLPHPSDPGMEWVNDYLSELRDFPNGAHNDMVDGTSQALSNLRLPSGGRATVPGRRREVSVVRAAQSERRRVGR